MCTVHYGVLVVIADCDTTADCLVLVARCHWIGARASHHRACADPSKILGGIIMSEQLPVREREPVILIPPHRPVDLSTLQRVRDGLVRLP